MRQKNAQQSSQQNQVRPQTLPTECDFPTLGATANSNSATSRGQIQDGFPALGGATRSPIPQAVQAQTDEVTVQPQHAGARSKAIQVTGHKLKRQKNAQQSSQQNQDRPQTLSTESDFPTLGAIANPNPPTPRGQIHDDIEEISEETLEKIRKNAVLEFKKESALNAIKEKYRCKTCKTLPRQGNDGVKKCKRCDKIFCNNCKRHQCVPTNRRDAGLKDLIADLPVVFKMEFEIKVPFLPLFCKNNKFGCEKMLFDDAELLKHEKYCEFYKVHCADIGCKTEVCLKNYIDHVKENHSDWKDLGEDKTFKLPSLPIPDINKLWFTLNISLKNAVLTKFGSYQETYQLSDVLVNEKWSWSSESKAIWYHLNDMQVGFWRIGEKSIIGSRESTFKAFVGFGFEGSETLPTDAELNWECVEENGWKQIEDISIDIQSRDFTYILRIFISTGSFIVKCAKQ